MRYTPVCNAVEKWIKFLYTEIMGLRCLLHCFSYEDPAAVRMRKTVINN